MKFVQAHKHTQSEETNDTLTKRFIYYNNFALPLLLGVFCFVFYFKLDFRFLFRFREREKDDIFYYFFYFIFSLTHSVSFQRSITIYRLRFGYVAFYGILVHRLCGAMV